MNFTANLENRFSRYLKSEPMGKKKKKPPFFSSVIIWSPYFFFPSWPTYCQQPDVELPLHGGLSAASHLWIFHRPAQQIFSRPFFPKLLIILCFCLSTRIFYQDLSFSHNINVSFPSSCLMDDLSLLFKDWEWIVHTRLEPQQLSDREGLRDSPLVCLRKHALSVLEVKMKFRRRKHFDPEQTHVGRLVMTVSDLWPLTVGGCVSDEHLEGLLTCDLLVFTLLMVV